MAKNKVDMNKNFENLKAQMLKKRELAETVKKEITNEPIASSTVEVDKYKDKNKMAGDTTNRTEDSYDDTNENINSDVNIKANTNVSRVGNKPAQITDITDLISPEEEMEDSTLDYKNMANEKEVEYTSSEYVAKKTGMVSDININKIVIKKVEKQEQPKRITYYLRPETIKKIDRFSKLSGMGKSEFVQKILDEVLNNLEIEK